MKYGHILAALLLLVFLLILGSFLSSRSADKVGVSSPQGGQAYVPPGSANPVPSPGPTTQGYYTEPITGAASVIVYTDQGFTPESLSVNAGTVVTFVNNSSRPFWVASDPHPAHNGYSISSSCGGSAFDTCAPIPAGSSWALKFDKIGNWPYHDHLRTGLRGAVIVK